MPRQPAAFAAQAACAAPDPVLIRLLHRRRGWAWLTATAIAGLAAFAALAGGRLIPPSLHAAGVLATDFLALTAATGAGAALDETRFLRRAAPGARAAAAAASLHPVIWYAHRAPRQVQGRGVALLVLLVLLVPAAVALPGQASALAFLTGVRRRGIAAGQWGQVGCTGCIFPRHLVSGAPAALMILLLGFLLDLLAAYGFTALLAQARSVIPGPATAGDAGAYPLDGGRA